MNDDHSPDEEEKPDDDGLDATKPEDTTELRRSKLPFKQLGDYQLIAELGRGGMGVVYHAVELKLQRHVALKILPAHESGSAVIVERFLQEARAAAKLNHQHIVPIYHIGEDQGVRFFAMKLIEGIDLAAVVRSARATLKEQNKSQRENRNRSSGSTLKEIGGSDTGLDLSGDTIASGQTVSGARSAVSLSKAVARVGMQVADALSHAHDQGVIHRDIKPSNLLLDSDQQVWVSDFGLAQLQDAPSLTKEGQVVGTLHYMSPEQASGRRAFVDDRTDIYSLGVTLYELATTHRACRGRTTRDVLREITFERVTPVRRLNPRLPVDFETIICRATERNPADRYQSAAELADDLRKFLAGRSIETRRVGTIKRTQNWVSDRPLATALTVLGSLGIVFLLSIALFAAIQGQVALKDALEYSRQQFMIADATLEIPASPGKAVAICIEALKEEAVPAGKRVLFEALSKNYERRTVYANQLGTLAVNPVLNQFLLCPHEMFYEAPEVRATFYDITTGEPSGDLDSPSPITTAAFSLDGSRLVTAGSSFRKTGSDEYQESQFSTPVIWKLSEQREGRRWIEEKRFSDCKAFHLTQANFSTSGKWLALPSKDNTASVYPLGGTDGVATVLRGHSQPVLRCAFASGEQHVATWSLDGSCGLYRFPSGARISSINFESRAPQKVALSFSPDGKWLMLTDGEQALIHEVGKEAPRMLSRRLKDAVFVGEESAVALVPVSSSKKIQLLLPEMDKVIAECESEKFVDGLAPCADSLKVLAKTGDSIGVVDFVAQGITAEFLGHTDAVLDIRSPSGSEYVVTSSWDLSVRVWGLQTDLQRRRHLAGIRRYPGPTIGYSSDGKRAVIGSFDLPITSALNESDFSEAAKLSEHVRGVLSDGSILCVEKNRIAHRAASTYQLLNEIQLKNVVGNLVVLDDDRVLFKIFDGKTFGWSPDSDIAVQLNDLGQALYMNEDFSVPILYSDHKLFRLAADSWELEELVTEADRRLSTWCANKSEKRLAYGMSDGSIQLWNAETNQPIVDLQADGQPKAMRFCLNDTGLVVQPRNRKSNLQLWSVATDSPELLGEHSLGAVYSIDVDESGENCLLASSEGLYHWKLESNEIEQLVPTTMYKVRFNGDGFVASSAPIHNSASGTAETRVYWADSLDSDGEVQSRKIRHNIEQLHLGTQDGVIYASGGAIGAKVLNLEAGQEEAALASHGRALIFCDFDASNQNVVTLSQAGNILLQDLAGEVEEEIGTHKSSVNAACMSTNRQFLFTADKSGWLGAWNLEEERRLLASYEHGKEPVEQVLAFGDSGFVSRHGKSELLVWGSPSESALPQQTITFQEGVKDFTVSNNRSLILAIHGTRVTGVASLAMGEVNSELAETAPDASLWDAEGNKLVDITIEGDAIAGQFYEGGETLAIHARDGSIHVFDTGEGKPKYVLRSDRPYTALARNHEGSSRIYAANEFGFFSWQSDSGAMTEEYTNLVDAMNAQIYLRNWMVKSDKSAAPLVLSRDDVVRIPEDLVSFARELAPRMLTDLEKAKYFSANE